MTCRRARLHSGFGRDSASAKAYASVMSRIDETSGELRHRTFEEVRAMRLAKMSDEERLGFEATYRQERERLGPASST